ncbi:unnamed protein product [Arabidopsis halleri]
MPPKPVWEHEHHKVFVDLCKEQKMLGNKPGLPHILIPFQQKTGTMLTKSQLKNHWDTMVKQWKIWCRLVQCSDMKWDPQTKTFGASDQDWANYLQVNPDARQYRLNPPSLLKDLEFIFEASNVEGTSGSKRKRICKHPDEENDTGDEDTQSASNISTPQPKAYWSAYSHELFVNLLFQESLKENRPSTTRRNSHYPKETWNMMVESFNQKTGLGYTRKQLKNRYTVTREAWMLWCQAIGSPLMKWDANTRTFGASDEEWKNYLKENEKAAPCRRNHIRHADKLAIIFKGRIEPGKAVFRPYRKRVINHHSEAPHDPAPSSALYTNEPEVTGSEGGSDDDDIMIDHHSESPQDPAPSSALYTNEPVTGSEGRADDDDSNEPTPHHGIFNGVGVEESQDVETVTPKFENVLAA